MERDNTRCHTSARSKYSMEQIGKDIVGYHDLPIFCVGANGDRSTRGHGNARVDAREERRGQANECGWTGDVSKAEDRRKSKTELEHLSHIPELCVFEFWVA